MDDQVLISFILHEVECSKVALTRLVNHGEQVECHIRCGSLALVQPKKFFRDFECPPC